MASFNLWSSISDVFVTASGPLSGEVWGDTNGADGDQPLWSDDYTAAGALATTANAYTLVVAFEDWVLTVQPLVTFKTETLVNPFGVNGDLSVAVVFSTSNNVGVGADIYWSENASGQYLVKYRPLTVNYPSLPTTGPNVAVADASETLLTAVATPLSWYMYKGPHSFIYSYATAGASDSTENIYIQGFTAGGVAEHKAVEIANFSKNDLYYIGYTASSDKYYFAYLNTQGLYYETFNPTTDVLGAVHQEVSLSGFTSVNIVNHQDFANGSTLVDISGLQGGDDMLEAFLVNPQAASPTSWPSAIVSQATSPGSTLPFWSATTVYDESSHADDEVAFAFEQDNQVHLDLYNSTGLGSGSDVVIPGLTSFDRIHALRSRVEIDYTYTDPNGQSQIGAVIYDTATSDYVYDLSGGGEAVGTPFDDFFADGPGNYFVDGGGGVDEFAVEAGSNAVKFESGLNGDLAVVTSGGTATLDRFTYVKLSDEKIELSGAFTGGIGTPEFSLVNNQGTVVAGYLEFAAPLSSAWEIDFAQGSKLVLDAGERLGASIAIWAPTDKIIMEGLTYKASEHLAYVALSNSSLNGELLLENSANDVLKTVFTIVSGTYSESDFTWTQHGTGSKISF